MYEKKDTQPALPAHDGSSDGSGDLPFDQLQSLANLQHHRHLLNRPGQVR